MKGLLITLLVLLLLGLVSVGALSIAESIKSAPEKLSPSNWVEENQIKVFSDKVIIQLENPTWAKFTNTNSMDPFIDENSHAIEITPKDAYSIHEGDVISYEIKNGQVIHRVINRGFDQDGVYYIVQGDNNSVADPNKVRFGDVVGVVVAVIY
jgi:signal peptidase I